MNKWLLVAVMLMSALSSAWADISVDIKSLTLSPALKGGESQSALTVQTSGEGFLLFVDYTVTCGGVTTTQSMDLFDLQQTTDGAYTLPITFRVPANAGRYATTVEITSVNYSDPVGTKHSISGSTSVVERQAPRYTLVEEFTGTGCGNCPRGWLGMKRIKEQASNMAGVIAIHQYNGNDPMYTPHYRTPSYTGAPACWLDRALYPDPLEGVNEEGIIATLTRHNAQHLPTVATSINASYSADGTGVDISSSTEFLTDGTGYTIAYALTADGLTGSETKWKQTNYYNDNSAWMLDLLYPGLGMEIFGKGGQYGTDPVQLIYDDVLIGSTWQMAGNALQPSTVAFSQPCTTGSTHNNTGSIKLPTSTSLRAALDLQRIYATVIVLDEQGRVANAARCRVEEPTHISSALHAADTPIQTYDLQGRSISLSATQYKGLLIQQGRKYMVR